MSRQSSNQYRQNHLLCQLRAASLGRKDHVFARSADDSRVVSYRQLFDGVEQVAAALRAAGVETGDRVAAQVSKSIETLELYLGTVLAGAAFLPLNTAYTADEIGYFLGDAEPALFVCDPAREAELAPVAISAGVKTLWTLDETGAGSLSEAKSLQNPGFEGVERDAADLAAILYTSGTTGRSKGAMLSHRALESNSAVLRDYWRFSADDVLIHALPIFHTHGLFVAVNITLMAAASMIFMQRFDAGAIVDNMPRASVLMGVPTFYQRLLEQPELETASASMRLFVSGSAPLLAATHDRWRERTGHAILERYGMTESNMNTSNPYDGERRAGTVGFALPGVEVIVTDPASGEALPQGETGAIEVRGPNLFDGYWRMPEKTAEELRDNGFFITGDLGLIDADGYLHIVGRSKDLIISGGYNIYPKEIEALLDAAPGVAESAVVGVPHGDLGEGVIAVIVAEAGESPQETEVLAVIADKLARFKQPRRVFFVDSLPRNAMGKVQKNQLRDRYGDALQ